MPFSIIRNDITKIKADAIVDTANTEVAIGGGVDAAIYRAAGEERLLAARSKIGVLEPGEVGITPAFDMEAKYIIHASGPWWDGGDKGEADLLRQCYDKSLALAVVNGCESIAFPLLATGTYGFPKELGLQIAIDAFTEFLQDHEMEITLVVFGEDAYHVSGKLFDDVQSFIDEEYVSAALEDEYACALKISDEDDGDLGDLEDEEFDEDSKVGAPAPDLFDGNSEVGALAPDLFDEDSEMGMPIERIMRYRRNVAYSEAEPKFSAPEMCGAAMSAQSLDDELKQMYTDSFEKHLRQLINKKGLKNSEIYSAANISKQYFSKLLKGQVKPSKEKVLSLAVGLRLNLDETVDFLRLAGYALSPISQTDVVVKYFIVHEDYNVMKIDVTLFDYGLEPLSKG